MAEGLVCQRRANLTTALTNTETSPTLIACRLYDAARAKHKQRGLEFNLSFEHVLAEVERGHCKYTGIPFDHRQGQWLPFRVSLDRRDNARGYLDDNADAVIKIVNQAKGPWDMDTFDKMCIARCKQLGLISEAQALGKP